jgi:transposase
MAESNVGIYGGVDTHKDDHVAAVIDRAGRLVGTASFPATGRGYRALVTWMAQFGSIVKVGVEGTGAYGAGLARHLAKVEIDVVEVNRPNRQMRRRRGKNDTVDAEAAARAALNTDATAIPKSHDGIVESIRVLRIAFCSARDARVRVSLQIRDVICTAPDELREALEPLNNNDRAALVARFRPGSLTDPVQATKASLRSLGRRYEELTIELDQLRGDLDELTRHANPALRRAKGVGPDVAALLLIAAGDNPHRLRSDAAFAALCGANPIEASSGRTVRHRLNRGGNRQANHALWRIALTRLATDPNTKAYATRRRAEGKTTRDIIRCLKRYIAREVYHLLTHPPAVTDPGELRTARLGAGLSLTDAARALDTIPIRISELERNIRRNDQLEHRYRTWLNLPAA